MRDGNRRYGSDEWVRREWGQNWGGPEPRSREERDEAARAALRALPRSTLRGWADDPGVWATSSEEREYWQALPAAVFKAEWSSERIVREASHALAQRRPRPATAAQPAEVPVWRQEIRLAGHDVPVWALALAVGGGAYLLARSGGSGGDAGGGE
jgi:hypothetical protein